MTSREREDRTIDRFCKRLEAIEQLVVSVLKRPDRDNPGKRGCDAIIERGSRRFALEHTTIDSFLGQRADSDRFRRVLIPIEEEIRNAYPESWIEICIPAHAAPNGTNWSGITRALAEGCIRRIAEMGFGDYVPAFQPADVPFSVSILREPSSDGPTCFVMRAPPSNWTAQLEQDFARAIREKRDQLAPYQEQGLPTILLLDSDDIHVNRRSLVEGFSRAAKRETTEAIDEVYITESSRDPVWLYPVKLHGRVYPEVAEFPWFFRRQYLLTYGREPR